MPGASFSEPQDPRFAALVRVTPFAEVARPLAALQGQGPVRPEDVVAHVQAGIAGRGLRRQAGAPRSPNGAASARMYRRYGQVASLAVLTLRHHNVQHWQDSTIAMYEVRPASLASSLTTSSRQVARPCWRSMEMQASIAAAR